MSERWNLQFRNGILYGVTFLIVQILFSFFDGEGLIDLFTQPNFYFLWLLWFFIGMFIIGYVKWKFPLRVENITEKQLNKEIEKGNLRNYIINYVVFFISFFGLINSFDDFNKIESFNQIIFKIVIGAIFGVIFGYVEWKNVNGKYNSWTYVFKRLKVIFLGKKKEVL
jgi:hypothetical protein